MSVTLWKAPPAPCEQNGCGRCEEVLHYLTACQKNSAGNVPNSLRTVRPQRWDSNVTKGRFPATPRDGRLLREIRTAAAAVP
jgi:hypothetical protein